MFRAWSTGRRCPELTEGMTEAAAAETVSPESRGAAETVTLDLAEAGGTASGS